MMEYWSIGITESWTGVSLLQHSISPLLQLDFIEPRRVAPEDLTPLIFRHARETFINESLGVRPARVGPGKLRRPHDIIRAYVAGVALHRIIPSSKVTLPAEHFRGF